jgi:hypothetical protein
MNITSRLLLSAVLVLGSFGMAQGQSTISYFSSFAKPGQPVPKECIEAKAVLADALTAYPHPDKWTYIIACDNHAWQQVMTHLGMTESDGHHLGETDFSDEGKLTYLNGAALVAMDDVRTTAEHVVAHELSHIYLHSRNEVEVDKLATEWVSKRQATRNAALVASVPVTSPSSK